MGLYAFARGFLYLALIMISMWFMSIGSDIYVFICMGFVLVNLFDEWVYNFYNGGYLSSEDLGVLAF